MDLLLKNSFLIAKNYNNIDFWKKLDITSYELTKSSNLLIPASAHMSGSQKWNKDTCIESALPFQTKTAWKRKSFGAYNKAIELNIINECCSHMPSRVKWNFEACINEACKYSSPLSWQNGSPSSYQAALSKNKSEAWKDKCIEAMNIPIKENITLKEFIADAKKYKTPTEWKKNSRSIFNKARKNITIYMACIAKMKKARIPIEFWTEKRCIAIAKKFSSRKEWRTASSSSYLAAKKNPEILTKCVKHMPAPIKKSRSDVVLKIQ